MTPEEEEDSRVVEARKKLRETEREVAEEKRAQQEEERRKQEEGDRRAAEKMLRQRMRQEAQETISRLFEAKRTSRSYEDRRSTVDRDDFIDNFPDSQTDLELEMFPIYEEVLREELNKRRGKKLPKELREAISLLVAEQDW
ncbi:MAG: hypothetical protein ACE5I4_06820 [Thermoplasmata archaeon]